MQIIDSQITTPRNVQNYFVFQCGRHLHQFHARPRVPFLSMARITNAIGNTLSFYNTRAWLKNTNALDDSPGITLASSTLTVSNQSAVG